MNLDFVPVLEKEASRHLPKPPDTLRVFRILWDSPKATLSRGNTFRTAPG